METGASICCFIRLEFVLYSCLSLYFEVHGLLATKNSAHWLALESSQVSSSTFLTQSGWKLNNSLENWIAGYSGNKDTSNF